MVEEEMVEEEKEVKVRGRACPLTDGRANHQEDAGEESAREV